MSKYNFTLTKDELAAFGSQNSYATMRFMEAGDDYVAARCLILNTLFPGFPLFSVSVEKMLKAMFYLETGTEVKFKKATDRHNPLLIKRELSKHRDFNLDKFDDLFARLYGHYQWRYYENKDKSRGMGTGELKEFDALWWELFENLQVPIEIKYRNKFTSSLFEDVDHHYFDTYRYWCLQSNDAFLPHIEEMKAAYDAVTSYLYPPKPINP